MSRDISRHVSKSLTFRRFSMRHHFSHDIVSVCRVGRNLFATQGTYHPHVLCSIHQRAFVRVHYQFLQVLPAVCILRWFCVARAKYAIFCPTHAWVGSASKSGQLAQQLASPRSSYQSSKFIVSVSQFIVHKKFCDMSSILSCVFVFTGRKNRMSRDMSQDMSRYVWDMSCPVFDLTIQKKARHKTLPAKVFGDMMFS